MKISRIFLAGAAATLALASCSEVKNELTLSEYDESKTPVASLTYIEEGSSDTKAVFEIDAIAAAKAGATSYTIFLATSMDDDVLGNAAFYKNITVDETTDSIFRYTLSTVTTDQAKKVSLVKGDLYIPMIRANYPPYVHSAWTKVYAAGSDRLVYEVGYGMRAVAFEAPAAVTATSTDESITASWRRVPYASSYTIEYKKTSAADWQVITGISATLNSYTIEGLTDYTDYDVRVKAVGDKGETGYTAIAFKTQKTNKFKTKEQLTEFFESRAAAADAKAVFTLLNDIDMGGATVPSAATFAATLDGQGHAIKNLKITKALFLENSGKIANVVLDASCQVAPEAATFAPLVLVNKGEVSGCKNQAAVKYESKESITGLVTIAGLVVLNEGKITDCSNEAPVSFIVNGTSESFGIAGVAAVTCGSIENSSNSGKVSCSLVRCSARVTGDMCSCMLGEKPAGCLGGVACYGGNGMAVKGCTNTGALDYVLTDLSGAAANINRNQIAGIVAAPSGDITDCNNSGDINVNISKVPGKEYIVGVAGISGGDYFAAYKDEKGTVVKQTSTNITNCTNKGNITVYSDVSASNSTVGGIVAWPGVEGTTQTTCTLNCTNYGDIFVSGKLKGRFGGVQGGSGSMEGSFNYGNIKIASTVNSACVAGSLCGFHSNGLQIVNCGAFGSVIAESSITGCGGLIGNVGNAALTTGTGCKVNCELTCPNTVATGLVVGYFSGKTKEITLGGSASQIKVAGKVNDAAVTADNYSDYLNGSKNFTASVHHIYAEYGE